MTKEQIIEIVIPILNSPIVITAFASAMVFILNWIYTKKPLWKKYEGTIVSAIKQAEKAIPDDTSNKAMARLDWALQYVIRVYQEREGINSIKTEDVYQLKEGINIVHAKESK